MDKDSKLDGQEARRRLKNLVENIKKDKKHLKSLSQTPKKTEKTVKKEPVEDVYDIFSSLNRVPKSPKKTEKTVKKEPVEDVYKKHFFAMQEKKSKESNTDKPVKPRINYFKVDAGEQEKKSKESNTDKPETTDKENNHNEVTELKSRITKLSEIINKSEDKIKFLKSEISKKDKIIANLNADLKGCRAEIFNGSSRGPSNYEWLQKLRVYLRKKIIIDQFGVSSLYPTATSILEYKTRLSNFHFKSKGPSGIYDRENINYHILQFEMENPECMENKENVELRKRNKKINKLHAEQKNMQDTISEQRQVIDSLESSKESTYNDANDKVKKKEQEIASLKTELKDMKYLYEQFQSVNKPINFEDD